MKKTRQDQPSTSETAISRRVALLGISGMIPALANLACGDGPGVSGGSGGSVGSGGVGSGGAGSGGAGALGSGGLGSGGGTSGSGGAASGGAPGSGGAGTVGAGGALGTGGGGSFTFTPIGEWDAVPVCQASYSDRAGQGPFMIHELEVAGDVSIHRQDLRGQYDPEAEAGVEMQLHLRILDGSSGTCSDVPVPDVEVYVWNTDAQGYYSGFGTRGESNEQKPDVPYGQTFEPGSDDLDPVDQDRFCRGVQLTGQDGVVSFRTIFPGWYNGRDVHIHVLLLKKDSQSMGRMDYAGTQHYLTTQFYFEPELVDQVHKSAQPYLRRTEGSLASTYEEAKLGNEAGNSGIRADAVFEGGIVVAKLNVLVNPAQSLTYPDNGRP